MTTLHNRQRWHARRLGVDWQDTMPVEHRAHSAPRRINHDLDAAAGIVWAVIAGLVIWSAIAVAALVLLGTTP